MAINRVSIGELILDDINVKKEYHSNGQLRYECHYKNGIQHGPARGWKENGQMFFEYFYDEGHPHGVCRGWDKKGRLTIETPYVHGLIHGVERQFDKKGNETKRYYFNGNPIYYNPAQAQLMAAFIQNLGYHVEALPLTGPQLKC